MGSGQTYCLCFATWQKTQKDVSSGWHIKIRSRLINVDNYHRQTQTHMSNPTIRTLTHSHNNYMPWSEHEHVFFPGGKVFHPILGIPWSRLIASWMFKGSSARTPSSTSSFMTWFIPIFQHQIKGNVAGKPVLLCFCWMVFCRSSKPFSTFLFGGYIGRFHQQRWAKTRRRNEWTTGLIFTMDGNAWSDGHVTINKWR